MIGNLKMNMYIRKTAPNKSFCVSWLENICKNLSDEDFRITISWELEKHENSQYPLKDILNKYYVICTE